ncbi:MAG TPA: hypothetical protein VN777_14065 [Terriglobales bacterium]|jgi:hypothetical protein|nr:hypothetical protein [Terriglobales bacterium]
MARPRQKYNDCVVAVFRELTGEDEQSAEVRFIFYLKGEHGTTSEVLRTCLRNVGWTMTPDDAINEYAGSDGAIDRERLAAHWRCFQGEAVMFYNVDGQEIGHAVVVRSGGIVFDPRPSAPEEGEFITDHFKNVGGKTAELTIFRVAKLQDRRNR